MADFGEFLSRLGNLHDCTITVFEWKPDRKRIAFEIDDLYFNFHGLPEYKGPVPGRIVFERIERVVIEMHDVDGPLRISDFCVVGQSPEAATVAVTFWPSGKVTMIYGAVTFPDVHLP